MDPLTHPTPPAGAGTGTETGATGGAPARAAMGRTRRARAPRAAASRLVRPALALAARLALPMVVFVAALLAPAPTRADEPTREQQVKAAFLYNFLQFVEWPADAMGPANAPYVIGVLGPDDPLRGAVDRAVAGKRVGPRPVVVKHFASADEVGACHMLYVADAGARDVARAQERLRGAAVLVVGDEGGVDAGAAVGFYNEDNRVRLEVSLRAVERARLHFSSRLLKLCRPRD